MKNWKEIKLRDVAKVISGFAFKSSDFSKEEGIPAIKIKNIKNGDVDLTDTDFVDNSFLKIHQRYHVNKNDILISLTGSHLTQPNSVVGRIAMYRKGITSLLNQRAGKILLNENLADRFFIYAFLSQDTVREEIALKASGAANQANISPSDVEATNVLLPPLSTQRQIAQILTAYDDMIENNIKRIKLLEEMSQITYEEWFVRFNTEGVALDLDAETGLPVGWERRSLASIGEFLNGYAFKPEDWQEEGMPIIKIKELKNGIGNDTPRNIGISVPEKYIIQTGDILFSWSASLEVVQWQGETGLLNQHLFKVMPKKNVSKSFLFLALKNSLSVFNNLTTGATMKHIKRKELDFVEIAIASYEIMNQFENTVSPVLTSILNLNYQNRLLKEARDILLPRLMSGAIKVED